MTSAFVSYYTEPGPFTAIPDTPANQTFNQTLLKDLPRTIPALVEVVQNNLIHVFWAKAYGVELSDERKAEVQFRSVAETLRRIHANDPAPLTIARPPEKKIVHNCRHFSTLLAALLQYQGIPARVRCGFGTYFIPNHYEDHWVCEYYNTEAGRWIQVDAQLDQLQRDKLQIDFDPLDVPRDRFINGGRAWQMCRQEGVDPDKFGIFDMKGLWFVRGNMIRDFASLNKMGLLPWDCWGLILAFDESILEDVMTLMDRVAALCEDASKDTSRFDEIRALYDTDERLRVPPVFKSFVGGPEPQDIKLEAVITV